MQSIERYCRTENGYVGLRNVYDVNEVSARAAVHPLSLLLLFIGKRRRSTVVFHCRNAQIRVACVR